MCGIAGYINLDGTTPAEEKRVVGMCDAIVHRGPDDSGLLVDGPLGIGMRRLSIIDLAGGHQPMSNETDDVWVVFNGEIYNHNELRESLRARGHRFRTRSDTEVIVHGWEEYGIGCVDHLRGMFGFCVWDSRTKDVFIARDRLGIKPLFYSLDTERLVFGSEIKAVLAQGNISDDPDWTGIDAYFAYGYIPAPLTGYKAITKLPAGHYLHLREGHVAIRRYWDLKMAPKHTMSPSQMVDDLVSLTEDSVKTRLMSEVPLGSFLSGGIDSSLVVAMMAKGVGTPIRTFTIGFGGSVGGFLDERPFAREVSRRYATVHSETTVLPRIEEALLAGVHAFDEPFADDSLIPTYHICEEAKKAVTVVMTGLGGDENFAGYERYLGFKYSQLFARIPRFIREGAIAHLVNSIKEERSGHYRVNHLKRFVAASSLEPGPRWQSYLCARPQAQRRQMYSQDIRKQIDFDLVDRLGYEHFERLDHGDQLDRALFQDMNMYLPEDILALSDRIGMLHSLELRVPLVDHRLVEFCAKIPNSLKIRRGEKKHLLRRAARDHVPPSVLDHRKQGFASPMASWLRRDLLPLMEGLLGQDHVERDGILNPAFVSEALDDHLSRRRLNDKLLFSLLVFQVWRDRRSLDG